MKARIIRKDGETFCLEMFEGKTLEFLYNYIGCTTVDVIRLIDTPGVDGLDMWVDDEGNFTADNGNSLAEKVVAWIAQRDPSEVHVNGHVVVTGQKNGETVGLTDEQDKILSDVIERLKG